MRGGNGPKGNEIVAILQHVFAALSASTKTWSRISERVAVTQRTDRKGDVPLMVHAGKTSPSVGN